MLAVGLGNFLSRLEALQHQPQSAEITRGRIFGYNTLHSCRYIHDMRGLDFPCHVAYSALTGEIGSTEPNTSRNPFPQPLCERTAMGITFCIVLDLRHLNAPLNLASAPGKDTVDPLRSSVPPCDSLIRQEYLGV